MPGAKEPRDRSLSGEFDDSDYESHVGEGSNLPGKPGRKKNPNSQAARRDQNRIAQREFRLRKQQRIRDLEARVEILSGGKDEALGEMRNILRDLMAENQTLRGLLRGLGAFIGDGAGGLLPKLGWDVSDFNQFINRSETDTAWEGYQQRKKTVVESSQGQKRPAEEESMSSHLKKTRSDDDGGRNHSSFSLLVPMSAPSIPPNGVYTGGTRSHEVGLMRGSNNSPMYMQQASPAGSTPQSYSGPSVSSYQPSYVPGVNMNIESSLQSIPFNTPNTAATSVKQNQQTRHASPEPLNDDDDDDDDGPSRDEAYKLILYHLDNFNRNNQYCLPSSLRPSAIQRTVPHESVIDGILHSELRDRMIIHRDRYDLADCLMDYKHSVIIHGDDVLAHNNWEIREKFLRKYGFLIDKTTLNITNRWRRERGEPEILLSDIGGTE